MSGELMQQEGSDVAVPAPVEVPTEDGVTTDAVPTTSPLFTPPAEVKGDGPDEVNIPHLSIKFQSGPIPQYGFNGIQIEDVIDVLVSRLESFQLSPMACAENGVAIEHLGFAKQALVERTEKRKVQGVEGTNEPHAS